MNTDSLYYIMDYSSNYYRVDKADQLVVAASEDEATVFTFSQANSRICVGKKASFYCMIPIEDEGNRGKLCEMNNENMQAPDEDIIKEQDGTYEHILSLKELTYDEIQEPIVKNGYTYDLSEMDWVEYLTHFIYVASAVKNYRDELTKKHSDIDQKICDILHYIELCETNSAEAVDLVELLRVCHENRRNIKDELTRTEYFQSNFGNSANVAKANQVLKSIKGLETRKYKPRKYDELFENAIKKDRPIAKSDVNVINAGFENKKINYSLVRTVRDRGDENIMAEEKNYTPYDGKENNWIAFAKEQAEFYRNAGKYIKNLQITICEIDQEIEGILQETEDANFNVTQGYKIYKRLKELRLEKKKIEQELKCMHALTDYIDCDALADACEMNLTEVEQIMQVGDENVDMQEVCDEEEQTAVIKEFHDMVG